MSGHNRKKSIRRSKIMTPLRSGGKRLLTQLMIRYIEFVYRTSTVTYCGPQSAFQDGVVALFWHGESYCLYPALRDANLCVITTADRRGDYISDICHHFGYQTLRFPDVSDGKNYLMLLKKAAQQDARLNFAISLDGPLGPYHAPKDFPLVSALLTKRAVLPVSVSVNKKLLAKRRWDRFVIPMPFNQITIHFNDAIPVSRTDRKGHFSAAKGAIAAVM